MLKFLQLLEAFETPEMMFAQFYQNSSWFFATHRTCYYPFFINESTTTKMIAFTAVGMYMAYWSHIRSSFIRFGMIHKIFTQLSLQILPVGYHFTPSNNCMNMKARSEKDNNCYNHFLLKFKWKEIYDIFYIVRLYYFDSIHQHKTDLIEMYLHLKQNFSRLKFKNRSRQSSTE